MLNSVVNGFLYATAGILYSLNKPLFWDSIHSQNLALIFLVIGIIVNIIFYVKNSRKSKSLQDLKEANDNYQGEIQLLENQIQQIHRNYSEIFNEHLASLFFKLRLKDTERISMYKFQND